MVSPPALIVDSTYSPQLLCMLDAMLEKSPTRRPFIDRAIGMFPPVYQLQTPLDLDNFAQFSAATRPLAAGHKHKKERLLDLEFQELKARLRDPNPWHFLVPLAVQKSRVATASSGLRSRPVISHKHIRIQHVAKEQRAQSSSKTHVGESRTELPTMLVSFPEERKSDQARCSEAITRPAPPIDRPEGRVWHFRKLVPQRTTVARLGRSGLEEVSRNESLAGVGAADRRAVTKNNASSADCRIVRESRDGKRRRGIIRGKEYTISELNALF